MKSFKVLSLILVFTLAVSVSVFADNPIDIGSSAIRKDTSHFVKTMYYEPRDRINNISFYNGTDRLDSIKDYVEEYKNNQEPGTATVIYTGVNNYTGTYTATFTIKKMPLSMTTIKASYNNKKALEVTVKNGSEKLKYGTDFTTTAVTDVDGNVTVKFYGCGKHYTGTVTKIIKAKDNPNPAARSFLKDVAIKKSKNIKGKKIELKWKKIKKIAGYQIKYYKKGATSSAKKIKVNSKTKKYIIKKLKKKKKYYIKMRCFIVYNNKTYYGNWTAKVKVKIKK